MYWRHEVNRDWMNARSFYLNASSIKKLAPTTATGRKRNITDEDYLAIYAERLKDHQPDDCTSTGVAARGHILEPYAIDAYNTMKTKDEPLLYHWDDIVLHNNTCGFSPDALDIPQRSKISKEAETMYSKPTVLGEVKCYDASKHILTANTPIDKLEERWQIAMAMHVCPTIEQAKLILFNPSMMHSYRLIIRTINKDDLKDELDAIAEIETKWTMFLNKNFTIGQEDARFVSWAYNEEHYRNLIEQETNIL